MLELQSDAASEVALDEGDREAIDAGLLRVLLKRQRFSSSTSWLGFGFMAWLMQDAVAVDYLAGWVGCMVLLELLALGLLGLLRRSVGAAVQRRRWLHGLTVLFFVYGAAWGSATALPGLWNDATLLQVILVCVATVALFSIHNLSTYWPMLLAFCVGVATPLWGMGLVAASGAPQVLWALCAVLMVLLIQLYGISSYAVHRHDIEGRVMARKLAQQLKQSNQELTEALQHVQRLATLDPLTHCLNRRALMDALQQEERRRSRCPVALGIVMLDLDHFKSINDTHGHAVGDAVLVAAAARVRARLRETDLLARWGGEEFVCVLMQVHGESLMAKAQDLCSHLAAAPLVLQPWALTVTASWGIALWEAGESIQACIDRADAALYRAKRAGRNQVSR